MASAALKRIGGGLEIRVHVQPKASRTEFTGLHGNRLKLRVQAKPVEGAANEAVRRFIAKTAAVAKSNVELIRGATSRDKDLRITCPNPAETARMILEKCGVGNWESIMDVE